MIHNLKTSLPTVPDNESYRAGSHVLPENKPTGGVLIYKYAERGTITSIKG